MTTTVDNFIRDLCATGANDPEAKRAYTKMLRCFRIARTELNTYIITHVKSKEVVVSNTMTARIEALDVIQAGKVIKYPKYFDGQFAGNDAYILPLGKRGTGELIKPSLGCAEVPESPPSSEYVFEYGGAPFYYMNCYYGELYGYKETRFFGFYSFDKEECLIHFDFDGCVKPGDKIQVKYRVEVDDEFSGIILPEDAPLLREYTLYHYWRNVNKSFSNEHLSMYRRLLRMYKHRRQEFSLDDIADAITRAYTNNPA